MRKSLKLFAGILVFIILISGIVSMTALAASNSNEADTDSIIPSQEDKIKKDKWNGDKNHGVRVNEISIAASVLGITTEEVKESIKTGKIGDLLIAADKVNEFKAAYLLELKTKLDAAVAEGKITQAEADEKYNAGKTKMDNYDGTTHLCGGKDHSKMFEKKDKTSDKVKTKDGGL